MSQTTADAIIEEQDTGEENQAGQTTAEEIITGQPTQETALSAVLRAVENLNEGVAAMNSMATQMSEAVAKLTSHSRVMANGEEPGHFSMGTGFEYDEATGRHNVTGTAAFEELLRSMTWSGPAASTTEPENSTE